MTGAREPLAPGATLGVLGGGQLGRMFVHAAQAMGYRTAVLDADPASPAGLVSHVHVQTAYLDEAGLATLAAESDAVTTEFENVPAAALEQLAAKLPVAPSGAALAVCQDRAREKAHFAECGVASAPHAVIEMEADLAVDPGLFPGSSRPPASATTVRVRYRLRDRQHWRVPGTSSAACAASWNSACSWPTR